VLKQKKAKNKTKQKQTDKTTIRKQNTQMKTPKKQGEMSK
jgi:hypothetical protein